MGLEVKRAIHLHERKGLDGPGFFGLLTRIADHDGVDPVLTRLPREYHAPFRDWIRGLPPLDVLIDLESGPIDEGRKATIRAISEWLDFRAGGEGPGDRAAVTSSGSSGH